MSESPRSKDLLGKMQNRVPFRPVEENLQRSHPSGYATEPASATLIGMFQKPEIADAVLVIAIIVKIRAYKLVGVQAQYSPLRPKNVNQMRFHSVTVRQKDKVRLIFTNEGSETTPDSGEVVGEPVKRNQCNGDRQVGFNPAAWIVGLEVRGKESNFDAGSLEALHDIESIDPAASSRWPVES
jgi:hypothetical protein